MKPPGLVIFKWTKLSGTMQRRTGELCVLKLRDDSCLKVLRKLVDVTASQILKKIFQL